MSWEFSSWRWVLWNLTLAVIPVALGYLLGWGLERFTLGKRRVHWSAWLPLVLVWLAFLPNTCYLLTEWRHYLFDPPMPDLIHQADTDRRLKLAIAAWGLFFLGYSCAGALTFVLAIRPVARALKRMIGSVLLPGVAFFFLASLGVYLGLIVRLNSWDLVTRPGFVFATAQQAMANPRLLTVMVLFAAGLYALFWTGDVWVDGFAARVRRRQYDR